jgi:hypothetical protein
MAPMEALLFSVVCSGVANEPPIEVALGVGLIGFGTIMLGGAAETDTDPIFLSAGYGAAPGLPF